MQTQSTDKPKKDHSKDASITNNEKLNALEDGELVTKTIRRQYDRVLLKETKSDDDVTFINNFKAFVVNGKIVKNSGNQKINSNNSKQKTIIHPGVNEYEMIARIYEAASAEMKPLITALLGAMQAKQKLPLDVVKLLSELLDNERKAHKKELNNERKYIVKLRELLGKADKRNAKQNEQVLKLSLKTNKAKIDLRTLESDLGLGTFGTIEQADKLFSKFSKRIKKMKKQPKQLAQNPATPEAAKAVDPFAGEKKAS